MRVFREGNQIVGIGFKYGRTGEKYKLGYGTKEYRDFEFLETERLMGHHGSASSKYVTSIGFVVQDLECSENFSRNVGTLALQDD